MGGARPAPAQRLHLKGLYAVGELDQPLGAGEELGAEVRGDTEGEDVQAQIVHDAGQLVDLVRGEELRLVDDHVVHPAALGELIDEVRVQVHALGGLDRLRDQAQPGGELPLPARSSRVKITPWSPRAERLCPIWRASVLFPQSIVPEKNTSSGMRG